MVKVLLVGYSGHQNFGDDLLLELAYKKFVEICKLTIWTNVLTSEADYLETWFPKATIIRSKDLGLKIFKQYDRVLYFGGGVFFDYKQTYPTVKYLKKRSGIFKNYYLAKLYGTRFGGIGIGLGPFLSKKAQLINQYRLSNFQLLGLRDQFSYDLAKQYSLNCHLSKACDLSFAMDTSFLDSLNLQIEPNSILVCPRKFSHNSTGDNYHSRLVGWCIKQQREGRKVTIFGFQSKHDEAILQVYNAKGLKTKIWDPHNMIIENVFKLFAQHQIIISARMHGVYVAGLVERASIGINVHPKVKDASRIFNNSNFLEPDFTLEDLEENLKRLSNVKSEVSFTEKTSSAQELYRIAQEWINNQNV